jgi:hypothetical protein
MDALDFNILKLDCDIVFSHSLIEHTNHKKFAYIVNNFNKSYFIQTPNKYFPMEPHFLIPLFQFLPFWLKVWIVKNIDTGISPKEKNTPEKTIRSINLLSEKDLSKLFPEATILGGKLFGMKQSFIAVRRVYENNAIEKART